MSVTGPSVTDTNIYTSLMSFLAAVLPDGTPVIQGLQNDVPEPIQEDFVVMIPLDRVRLATNLTTYTNPQGPLGVANIEQSTRIKVQLDFHGPNSGDNAQIAATLLRSGYGVYLFKSSGLGVEPLYAEDPRQTTFLNGEQQFEIRWIVDAVLQVNPVLTVPIETAIELDPEAIDVITLAS